MILFTAIVNLLVKNLHKYKKAPAHLLMCGRFNPHAYDSLKVQESNLKIDFCKPIF